MYLDGNSSTESLVLTLGEPNWGPIGEEVFLRTYSRELPDGQKEHWADTCRRVVNGNMGYASDEHHLPDEDIDLFLLMYYFRALPAGRHLWVTGTATSTFSRNCWVSGWTAKTSDHFHFLSSRLFEGGGVGANYSFDLLAGTSPLVRKVNVIFTCDPEHPDYDAVRAAAGDRFVDGVGTDGFIVDDSREGWTDLYTTIVDIAQGVGYVNAETLGTRMLKIDVSKVRPQGSPLRTFGGQASGPDPLVTATIEIADVVNGAAAERRRLTGLEAMLIDHSIAASVVAGGTRRSARIAAMRWDDPEVFDFIVCKTDHIHHWSANISIEINDDFHAAFNDPTNPLHEHAVKVTDQVVEAMLLNGEPGFIDTSLASVDETAALRICNPCGEVFLASADALGFDSAAGESCNLGSVNLDAFGTDDEGIEHAYRLLARFLYRATENKHAVDEAGIVENVNRRIGVGFMGLHGYALTHGIRYTEIASSTLMAEKLTRFAAVIRKAADDLADALGTPRAVKVTAIAPTGTIAQMAGCTSGIQSIMYAYFIRRVRFEAGNPALADYAAQGYNIVDDIYAANTKVVEFTVYDSILDRFPAEMVEASTDVSVGQFFDLVAMVQRTFCGTGNGNAISSTAAVDPEALSFKELKDAVVNSFGKVKGITIFPPESRPLPPYEGITKEQYDAMSVGASLVAGDSNDGECGPGGCPVR
jgi:ribonucleoside-triphosphate reductase